MRELANTCEDFHGVRPRAEVALSPRTEVLSIVGATATGKTDLAIDLAVRLGGEVICVDRKTAQDKMQVGTAAPTPEQRNLVKHHLLDVFNPEDSSVPRYVVRQMARACIRDVASRGKLPIPVGGSVYLIESLAYPGTYSPVDRNTQDRLSDLPETELVAYCNDNPNIGLPFEIDERRLLNHIIARLAMRRDPDTPPPPGTLVLGTRRPQEELEARIRARTTQMMANGLEDELVALLEKCNGFWPEEAKTTIGYGDFHPFVNQGLTPEESIIRRTLRFAEWQTAEIERRMPHTKWVDSLDQALELWEHHAEALHEVKDSV